jgi:ribosomal protein L29
VRESTADVVTLRGQKALQSPNNPGTTHKLRKPKAKVLR